MWKIEVIFNWWKTINDNNSTNGTTYSSEKIDAIVWQIAKIPSWVTWEILIKNADWDIVNSWMKLEQLALAIHNHNASNIVLSNVNFWGFLNLSITNLQELADYIDDYFTQIQEQWSTVEWESPWWAINWINTSFYLAHTPIRCIVFLNWVRQKLSLDYTLSSNIINFQVPPIPWDIIISDYSY